MNAYIEPKICVSAIYRDPTKSIEHFVWHHNALDCDIVFVIDTTGTMSEKMINSNIDTKKVVFVTLGEVEAASSDTHLVNSIILQHCRKHCIDWLLHLNIDDRIDLKTNYSNIHKFLKDRPECDGIVILKVKPNCTCKGESRCIVKVKSTAGYECEWKWKYPNKKNCTLIRATTNEVYLHGDYDRYQSVIRDKNGRSKELVQVVHYSYVDFSTQGWLKYFKSFVVSDTVEEEHDKDCTLYKEPVLTQDDEDNTKV